MNQPISETKTFTDIENRLMFAKEEGKLGEGWIGSLVSRYQLLYIEWMNKALLYSTGISIQYPGINHNGKEYIHV